MNQRNLIILVAPILLAACSGQALVSDTPDPSINANKTLTVQAIHHGIQDDAGNFADHLQIDGSKVFQNDQGITITLRQAGISWAHLHLISEGDDEECEVGHDIELDLESIENIMNEDGQNLSLVTGNIEDRAYCQYEIHLSPENTGSTGLNDFPEIEGKTVYTAGSWTNGSISGNFEVAVVDEIEITDVFKSMNGDQIIEHPLHFHEGEETKTITFENTYDHWFDGITFAESQGELETKLSTNIQNIVGQYFSASQ